MDHIKNHSVIFDPDVVSLEVSWINSKSRSPTTFYQNDDKAVILDVRTDNEVAAGIIPKAIQIDFYRGHDFIAEIQKLDKDKNYYVYCRSGNRSGQACKIMGQLGFKNAYNLIGGMMQWQGEIE